MRKVTVLPSVVSAGRLLMVNVGLSLSNSVKPALADANPLAVILTVSCRGPSVALFSLAPMVNDAAAWFAGMVSVDGMVYLPDRSVAIFTVKAPASEPVRLTVTDMPF